MAFLSGFTTPLFHKGMVTTASKTELISITANQRNGYCPGTRVFTGYPDNGAGPGFPGTRVLSLTFSTRT